jgi:hypothetical protein
VTIGAVRVVKTSVIPAVKRTAPQSRRREMLKYDNPDKPRFYHSVSVVRPQHVLQWEQNGDPTLQWFREAARRWFLSYVQSRAQCLTCDFEFNDREPPLAFVCGAVNLDADGCPKQVILTGVCGKCTAQTDHELLAQGLTGLRKHWPHLFGGTIHDTSEKDSDKVN